MTHSRVDVDVNLEKLAEVEPREEGPSGLFHMVTALRLSRGYLLPCSLDVDHFSWAIIIASDIWPGWTPDRSSFHARPFPERFRTNCGALPVAPTPNLSARRYKTSGGSPKIRNESHHILEP